MVSLPTWLRNNLIQAFNSTNKLKLIGSTNKLKLFYHACYQPNRISILYIFIAGVNYKYYNYKKCRCQHHNKMKNEQYYHYFIYISIQNEINIYTDRVRPDYMTIWGSRIIYPFLLNFVLQYFKHPS